ncbi:sodium:solute symporter family protein [Gimesia sp.]|uniref:sodium:solute symporter family protein n=1 Tax=Gimesia sp. TaxID=2024833 RepID=UPI000C44C98A|nr:sodium:solute symporter family protein [Gimesia sp.]MAX39818.1 sodium:solute symporter [Gimesia sp.]HBL44942.1 sodium:solute symporter [Planctomycetaceae bacterium]
MTFWLGILLAVYVLLMVGLGLYAGSRVNNEEDYLVAGRRLPLWLAWGTLLATWFGAATVLGASEAARAEGVRGTILDPFASGLALIVAGLFFARRVWEMQLLTVGDLFSQKYGRKTELVSSVVQALGYLPWIAAQYLALAAVLTHFFQIDHTTAIFGAALFVTFLTMIGGMWSVTLTDTVQICVVLVSLVLLGVKFASTVGEGSVAGGITMTWEQTPLELRTLLPEAGLVALLGWSTTWLNGVFGNIPGQDLMQRIFASRSGSVASRACLLAGCVYILFGLLPVGMGLASRQLWPDELPQGSDGHVILALAELFLSPPGICLLVVTVMAIVVSTCTSAMLSPAALLSHNLLNRIAWFHERNLLTNRLSVGFVAITSLPLALMTEEILELLESALAVGLVALLVPFVAGVFLRPRGELPGLLSIGCGSLFWMGQQIAVSLLSSETVPTGTLKTILTTVPPELTGLLASIAGYLIGQWISPRVDMPRVV